MKNTIFDKKITFSHELDMQKTINQSNEISYVSLKCSYSLCQTVKFVFIWPQDG